MQNSEDRSQGNRGRTAIILGILGLLVAIVAIVVSWLLGTEADFKISATPMGGSTHPGGVTHARIEVKGEGGYDYEVSLLCDPEEYPDVNPTFNPESGAAAAPGYESTMVVDVEEDAAPGTYTFAVKGTGADGKEHECKYTLTVKPRRTNGPESVAAQITSPKNGQEVPLAIEVIGTISGSGGLPKGRYMWVAINPHPSPGQWWPQGARIEPWRGSWSVPVRLGREEEDKGAEFDIAVVLMDEDDDKQWHSCIETGKATGDYQPVPLPESKQIADKITVKRANGGGE